MRTARAKATEYYIDPDVLRKLEFEGATTLRGIEKHRLRALILQDLEIYRRVSIGDMHARIGLEIPLRKLRRELTRLVEEGEISREGMKRWTTYLWTE
jgi:ATP-dependent DNA helicase RecG